VFFCSRTKKQKTHKVFVCVVASRKKKREREKLSMFFSALITPANLAILAVSALTAAWQAYSLGLFDAKDSSDEVKDSIDSYRKSLTESQSSQLEGIKNSNDEIIILNSLKGIIEDETLERSKRLQAIDKVNEIYPDLFKNLTQNR
jgi:hypothetical protein